MEQSIESLEMLVAGIRGDDLVAEIQRYLDAVALFRELGCEPRWRSEALPASDVVQRIALYARARTA